MKKYTLKELDDLILNIEQKTTLLNHMAPSNLEEEKQKFFDSKYKYNPQFKYKLPDYSELSDTLKDIKIDSDKEISTLYEDKIRFIEKRLRLITLIGQDNREFTKMSLELYGRPSSNYIENAKTVIQENRVRNTGKTKMLSFEEIYSRIKDNLEKHNLDTEIVLKESNTNKMKVNHFQNKIFLPKGKSRREDSLNGAIDHEIKTHLQRAVNGTKNEYGIFGLSTADYLPTEEGLATIMGHIRRKNKLMHRSAKLYIACITTLENDFVGTFNSIFKITRKPQSSFNQTLRVKRGIADTSLPGGFVKDQYFAWAIELGKKIIDNPKYLNYLFNGKASIEELVKYTQPTSPIIELEQIKRLFEVNKINT